MAATSGQEQDKVRQEQGNMGQEMGDMGQEMGEVGQELGTSAVAAFPCLGRVILDHLETCPD